MNQNHPVVVLSSLNCVLANASSESSDAAVETLKLLAREHIPLVFCSSNTRGELELVHQCIGCRHPFITESGGALFIPNDYFGVQVPNARAVAGYQTVEFGQPYADIVDALYGVARRLRIDLIGFRDMSVDEVAIDCNLPLLQARLAKLREYSERFRLREPGAAAHDRLVKGLRAASLSCTTEGRHQQVGFRGGVDRGVDLLRTLYRRAFGSVLMIGLGATENDAGLLRRMDVPIIVDSDEANVSWRLLTKVPRARVTSGRGVAGWAEAITTILDTLRRDGRLGPPMQIGARRS